MISPTQGPLPDNTQHSQQTSVPSAGFKPTIPGSERPQTHAIDSADTGTGCFDIVPIFQEHRQGVRGGPLVYILPCMAATGQSMQPAHYMHYCSRQRCRSIRSQRCLQHPKTRDNDKIITYLQSFDRRLFIVCVFAVLCVHCCFFTLDVGLLARSQYSEGPATGHLDTGFSWFPSVYKQMVRWFPRFQVATTCFSCSPPDLNLLVTNFMF